MVAKEALRAGYEWVSRFRLLTATLATEANLQISDEKYKSLPSRTSKCSEHCCCNTDFEWMSEPWKVSPIDIESRNWMRRVWDNRLLLVIWCFWWMIEWVELIMRVSSWNGYMELVGMQIVLDYMILMIGNSYLDKWHSIQSDRSYYISIPYSDCNVCIMIMCFRFVMMLV